MSTALTIILPIAGRGDRFKTSGFAVPKPLVPVLGEPLIKRVVSTIGFKPDDHLCAIHHTSLAQDELLPVLEEAAPGISLTLCELDHFTCGAAETVLRGLERLPDHLLIRPTIVVDGDGVFDAGVFEPFRKAPTDAVYCIRVENTEPIYSFVEADEHLNIRKIVEKQKVSSLACTGAYAFASGTVLRDAAARTVASGKRWDGECYMSHVVQRLLDDGQQVKATLVDKWACLGTPDQLASFCRRNALLAQLGRPEAVVELADLPCVSPGPSSRQPDERSTGYYLPKPIAPRRWHTLQLEGNVIRKSGPRSSIIHESLWYAGLPPELSIHTPRMLSQRRAAENANLELERVDGASFSHLLVEDMLGERELEALLEVLEHFHASEFIEGRMLPAGATIYDNYLPKLARRKEAILAEPETRSCFNGIVNWAREYQRDDRAQMAVIHGDPVFTNTLLTVSGEIKLVDPRGHLNGRSSLMGDARYDLAKVYQSLTGYDAVLLGRTQTPASSQLRAYFEEWVLKVHGREALDDIRWITASLYISLLPLHEAQHRNRFVEICSSLVEQFK